MSAPSVGVADAVDLAGGDPGFAARAVADAARDVIGLGTHLGATIDWAVRSAAHIPLPGPARTATDAATAERWSALATAAALDVGAARVLEPHLDALAILAEARADGIAVDLAAIGVDEEASWGVYAAEGGTARLTARRTPSGWVLEGTKPWCSLAQDVSHALVTAWTGEHDRRLFAVSMRDAAVSPHRGPWVARGLSRIVSAPVDFSAASAVPVGDDGWYLRRAGFAVGGMGVAAVWWGGALPLLAALRAGAAREGADQIAQMLLGEADALSWSARATLLDAAGRVDAAGSGADDTGDDLRILAERVRAVTAAAVERIVTRSGHALGPGPLTVDEEHARRVSDLKIYLRQHHAERDLARLGRLVAS